MEPVTVLLIILAGVLSLAIVGYQYPGIRKLHQRFYLYLAIVRFLAIFGILILLINPKFVKEQFSLEKSNLILLVDNSSSIANANMNDKAEDIVEEISNNQLIRDKYDLRVLSFDRNLTVLDSLTFDKEATDQYSALRTVQRTYNNRNSAIVLLTDGNQTVGTDYEFLTLNQNQSIYPVVIGDTTNYEDVLIERVNINKYAFLNNQYPIEVLVRYQGDRRINIPVTISVNGSLRYSETINLDKQNNSASKEILLRANSVGIKLIDVRLGILENEKNPTNNQQNIAIEVIDEKTQVAIVTDMNHPDIGALKKSIESNSQRKVQVINPAGDLTSSLSDADLLILYQPDRSFENAYGIIANRKLNYFTITGPDTDWRYLNQIQNSFQKSSFNQTEFVTPLLNDGFTAFNIADFSVDNFPPLNTTLGDLLITKPYEEILEQRIKGVEMGDPLFALLTDNSQREAVLFGENLWKWRVQSYRNDASFESFDQFISKIILYLSADETRQRLNVDYDNIYQNVNYAIIRASYFDEAFEFDNNASITLDISGVDNSAALEFPMLLKGRQYEADLSGLPSGTFNFNLRVEGKNISRSGQFTILDFDVEKQFLTADYEKLTRLASRSGGRSYLPDQSAELVNNLAENERFRPTQKSKQNVVSLIDFKALLALIVTAFAVEWFIRKYNGLI